MFHVLFSLPALTQVSAPDRQIRPSLDLAVTWNSTLANVTSGDTFWLQGGTVQVHGQFRHGLGAVADITTLHVGNMNSSGVGLDMVTITAGPRYTWTHNRFAVYGQFLLGEANGLNSVFPSASGANSSDHSFALQLGGGINRAISRRLEVRVLEIDWLRTQLPNATTNVQNNLKLGTGIVFRLR
jgi:peptidoglycan-associated lipoprotein